VVVIPGVLFCVEQKLKSIRNRYDKLQIIVCANGEAGINFEHTGVDGHTVLRYCAGQSVYAQASYFRLSADSSSVSNRHLYRASLAICQGE
jgi:hypothetical protein